ncbi:MAG: matrixin family metalloprotease [Planctomycetes bacterium]|nr:matrixin family metalloprotease [Planctomycetota bacterium]
MKRALLALSFLLLLPASGGSYVVIGTLWVNAKCTYHHDPATMGSAYLDQFRAAMDTWTNVSGSRFVFAHGGATTGNLSETNGITEVKFENLGMMGYAVTKLQFTGGVTSEADISFNNFMTWTTTGDGVNPDFQTVAVHELGHAVGLDHVSDPNSVMQTGDPRVVRRSLSADDIAGIRALYPDSATPPDPDPTPPPPPPTGPDLTVLSVICSPNPTTPGDALDVTCLVKNVGTGPSGPFDIDACLSASRRPAASDIRLGRTTSPLELEPGEIGVGRMEGLTIPDGLLPGYWMVGVLVDPDRVTTDGNPRNDSASALPGFRINRVPLLLCPGDSVRGKLGPHGQDSFLLLLRGATKVSFSGATAGGTNFLVLYPEGSTKSVAFTTPASKSRILAEILDTGNYELSLASGAEDEVRYGLKTRALPFSLTGEVEVDGETTVTLPVYPRSALKIAIAVLGGPPPALAVFGGPAKIRAKGAKIGVTAVAEEDEVRLVFTSSGAPATIFWSAAVKPPSKGTLHIR